MVNMSDSSQKTPFESAHDEISALVQKNLPQLDGQELENAYMILFQAKEALVNFDLHSLARMELGTNHNFEQAITPAQKIIQIYSDISNDSIRRLPFSNVKSIIAQLSSNMKLFLDIIKYNNVPPQTPGAPTHLSQHRPPDPLAQRDQILKHAKDSYETAFNALVIPWIYSRISSFDLADIQSRADSIVQHHGQEVTEKIKELENLVNQVNGIKSNLTTALTTVQKTAADLGVSLQAGHFKMQADSHWWAAIMWLVTTIVMGAVTIAYAFFSLFLHSYFGIDISNKFLMLQLAVSKVLVFAVLSFILYLASKNYMSHRHNCIVNRHREKALETFNVLVDSAGENVNKDIVLKCAADCIFSPQPTGYMGKGTTGTTGSDNVINLLTSAMTSTDK